MNDALEGTGDATRLLKDLQGVKSAFNEKMKASELTLFGGSARVKGRGIKGGDVAEVVSRGGVDDAEDAETSGEEEESSEEGGEESFGEEEEESSGEGEEESSGEEEGRAKQGGDRRGLMTMPREERVAATREGGRVRRKALFDDDDDGDEGDYEYDALWFETMTRKM